MTARDPRLDNVIASYRQSLDDNDDWTFVVLEDNGGLRSLRALADLPNPDQRGEVAAIIDEIEARIVRHRRTQACKAAVMAETCDVCGADLGDDRVAAVVETEQREPGGPFHGRSVTMCRPCAEAYKMGDEPPFRPN